MMERSLSLWRTAGIVWWLGYREHALAPWSLVRTLLESLVVAVLLLFLGQLVDVGEGAARVYGSYLSWSLIGFALLQLCNAGTRELPRLYREARESAWLDALRMTGVDLRRLLVVLPVFAWSIAAARALLLLFFGWWASGFSGAWGPTVVAALFLVIGALLFWAMGWIAGAFAVGGHHPEEVSRGVLLVHVLLGGIFFPRDLLPLGLQTLGGWLPIAPVIDGMRGALMGGASLAELHEPLARALLLLVVLVALGEGLMRRSLLRAARRGLLGRMWR